MSQGIKIPKDPSIQVERTNSTDSSYNIPCLINLCTFSGFRSLFYKIWKIYKTKRKLNQTKRKIYILKC